MLQLPARLVGLGDRAERRIRIGEAAQAAHPAVSALGHGYTLRPGGLEFSDDIDMIRRGAACALTLALSRSAGEGTRLSELHDRAPLLQRGSGSG